MSLRWTVGWSLNVHGGVLRGLTKDDCLCEIVVDVIPLGIAIDVVVSFWVRIGRVDVLSHIESYCSDHKIGAVIEENIIDSMSTAAL